MYNRDLGGTRYSPLKQITKANVEKLTRAWAYPLGRDQTAGTLSGGSEFTPIVVNGVMYVAASDHVAALEPETGKPLWRYTVTGGVPSRRGVTYWPGDGTIAPRIFFTSERRLIALDAGTGLVDQAFGGAGEIDMVAPYHSAPTLYRNLLILGTNGAPGGVRAFDARTGAKVWEFRSVPEPGRTGNETWEGDNSWKDRPGTYSWAFSQTIDAERGILYVAIEAPGPNDYWGGDRHGDNLYGNSLVALDAQTGAVKWHFQAVTPRSVGLRPAGAANIDRCDRERPPHADSRARCEDRLHVHPQPRDWNTGVRHRRETGAAERRSWRKELAHSAGSRQASADRPNRLQS